MQEKNTTFLNDPKEKARLRIKFFSNFPELTAEQQEEKNTIFINWPDLRYVN